MDCWLLARGGHRLHSSASLATQVLADELDDDALRLLSADHSTVISHRSPKLQ